MESRICSTTSAGNPQSVMPGKDAPQGMIAQQGRAVGAGQEGQRLLQPLAKLGNRHIGPAEEAIACADDGSHRGNLPLRGQKQIDDRRQRRAKQHQKRRVQQKVGHIRHGQIPSHLGQVSKAQPGGNQADNQRADHRGEIIAQRQNRLAYRRDGQIPARTGYLVLHHEHIGAKGYRHAAHRQQRRNQFAAHGSVNQLLRHRSQPCDPHGKAVPIDIAQKGHIQHQQNGRGDHRGEKHPLIPKKQLAISSYQSAQSSHFSAPPVNFLPVTARNTSSIRPLVIS